MAHPPPQTETYIDPTATLVSTSALDFLLIEIVPMAYRIASDLSRREEEWLQTSSATIRPRKSEDDSSAVGTAGGADTATHTRGADGTGGGMDEEEAREAVFQRLETLGYRVGLGVVER
jgi:hypothetical protein